MRIAPTGRREIRDDQQWMVLERSFHAPIEAVWAAVTESDRLARWIGTWTGDPTSGTVMFSMNAEGDDVSAEPFTITDCAPPRRLALQSHADSDSPALRLTLELAETAGLTTISFSQATDDPEVAASMGPGWEYYLDRLVAAEDGGDVAAIEFEHYFPAQADHYRRLFT